MSDGDLKFPEWQIPFKELLLEFDRQRLNERLPKLEVLLAARMRQVKLSNEQQGELQALTDAISTLRVLKRNLAGFQDQQ